MQHSMRFIGAVNHPTHDGIPKNSGHTERQWPYVVLILTAGSI